MQFYARQYVNGLGFRTKRTFRVRVFSDHLAFGASRCSSESFTGRGISKEPLWRNSKQRLPQMTSF